ncbi:MAG: hypothetical protein ABI597_02670 [Gammaproteobacteria bacterium]
MTLNNVMDAGAGIITLDINTNGTTGNFTMNSGSSITTTNASTDAVNVYVNNTSGGNGTAALRNITTGSGGAITIRTNTGNNTTGGDITQASGTLNTGGTGSITLINPNIANNNIGTTALPIQIMASKLIASSGNSGIFITNTDTTPLVIKTLEAFRSDTSAKGNAQIISNGIIKQIGTSNPVNVATLTLRTLNDSGANISFDNTNNLSTNINLRTRNLADTANSAGNISYTDSANINITGLDTTGDAAITANGLLTDSGTITVGGTLTASSVDGMTLDNTSQISGFDGTSIGGGNIIFSGNSVPLTITGLNQNGGGNVVFTNTTDINIANGASINTNGGTLSFTISSGMLSVGNSAAINSSNATISINATDINLDSTSSINSGSADISITQNTPSGSIGIGNAIGTLTLSGSELQQLTANNLFLFAPSNGQIISDGISSTNSSNIASTIALNATAGTLGSITFQNNPSTFRALTSNADNGITIDSNASLTTTVGNLALNGDAGGGVGGNDNITLNSNLTSAGSLILSATNGGIILGQSINLTGNDITFDDAINGAHDLTLNAGASGNIIFNADVGNIVRIGELTILNMNNLTNNALINAGSYSQSTGNTVNLGTNGLNLTGDATVTGSSINGALNVAGLRLDVNFADLNGFVDGASGQAAINRIILLNTISPGTHFFDGIDMYSSPMPPAPPVPPAPSPTVLSLNQIPQITFSYLYESAEDETMTQTQPTSSDFNLAELLSDLDTGKNKCVNLGSVSVCSENVSLNISHLAD